MVPLFPINGWNNLHGWFVYLTTMVRVNGTTGACLWNQQFQRLGLTVPTVRTMSFNVANCQFLALKLVGTKLILIIKQLNSDLDTRIGNKTIKRCIDITPFGGSA
jgi:hypothetical protein